MGIKKKKDYLRDCIYIYILKKLNKYSFVYAACFFFISFDLYSDSQLPYYNKNTSFLRKYHQNPFYFLHIIIPCNLYLFIMYIYVHNLQTDIKDAQKRFKENSWGYLTDKNKFEVAFMK